MKLLCVGGGSGGHVTPVLAVINELAQVVPDLSVVFVTDRAFLQQTKLLVQQAAVPVTVKTITAGKFRRYMDTALWKQVLNPDIGGRNLVDMFKVAGGVAQSIRLVRSFRPDVVFAKGGYVSLPVGYAAHLLRVPLVIHDSDARPGLTSRVLSRWAAAIATGMPLKTHRYNVELTTYTGIPIDSKFCDYTPDEQTAAKKALGVDPNRPLVVVTGGSLGARSINTAVVAIADQLIDAGYSVYHVAGKKLFDEVSAATKQFSAASYTVVPFMDSLSEVYGAADSIVARAGATTLQEIAASARPAIIVPASTLGDQPENAALYKEADAIELITDEALATNPEVLVQAVKHTIADVTHRARLINNCTAFARPDAAKVVAELLVKTMRIRKKKTGNT